MKTQIVLNSYSIKFRACSDLTILHLDNRQCNAMLAWVSYIKDKKMRERKIKMKQVYAWTFANSYPYKLINYLRKIDYVQVKRLYMWTHIKTVQKRMDYTSEWRKRHFEKLKNKKDSRIVNTHGAYVAPHSITIKSYFHLAKRTCEI